MKELFDFYIKWFKKTHETFWLLVSFDSGPWVRPGYRSSIRPSCWPSASPTFKVRCIILFRSILSQATETILARKNVNGNKFWHFGSNQNVQSKNNFDEILTGSHSSSRPTQRWTEGNKKKYSTNRIAVGKKKRRMSSSFDKRNGKFDRNKWSNYRQLFLFVWRKLANYNERNGDFTRWLQQRI
jgi:hypothetical protein